jgi:hypothetical protein
MSVLPYLQILQTDRMPFDHDSHSCRQSPGRKRFIAIFGKSFILSSSVRQTIRKRDIDLFAFYGHVTVTIEIGGGFDFDADSDKKTDA